MLCTLLSRKGFTMNMSSRLTKERSSKFSFMRTAAGALAVGTALAVSSFTMVRAEHANPDKTKTFSCSSGAACLEGNSSGSSTAGLYGVSSGSAVVGKTTGIDGNAGIVGYSGGSSGQGLGVYGFSSNGYGVYGMSTAFGSAGIAGFQLNTASNSGNALYGESADASGGFPVIYGQGDNPETALLQVNNVVNDAYCAIDAFGNVACSGSIDVKSVRARHLTSSGQHVLTYAAETASATLEDVGTGHMAGGVAAVTIDRAFGSTIDRAAYHIFLTPKGDASLYVAEEAPAGFVVRETHGGRSTLDFDYRIVARPLDAKNDRLPLAPLPKHVEKARGIHPAR
jgi:hypothetical protein